MSAREPASNSPEPLYCGHCRTEHPIIYDGAAGLYIEHVIRCCTAHIARLHYLGLTSMPDDTYPARPNLLRGLRYQ